MSQIESGDAPTPGRIKVLSRMERIRQANKMLADTLPEGPDSVECTSKDDKENPKPGLNDESRIITCKNSSCGNALVLNQRSKNTHEIQCLSDTELHNKSGVMYPFLCHVVQYEKATYQKNTKRATSRVQRKGLSSSNSVHFLHPKDTGAQTASDKICQKCLDWFMSQPLHKKLGILSSNSVSYFPQLLAEIERKGGIHKVFCHWDQLQNEYLVSLIRKRKANRHDIGNNHVSIKSAIDEILYCDTSIMKNLRKAEQRCTKAFTTMYNDFNTFSRSITFLPSWVGSNNFLRDISVISHGQFFSKYPADWVRKEEFLKHNPWERRVGNRRSFANLMFEVDWYACDNRHTFSELLVHRIELCIWRAWILEMSCNSKIAKNKSKRQKLELYLAKLCDKQKFLLDYMTLKNAWHQKLTPHYRTILIKRSRLSSIFKPRGRDRELLSYYSRKIGEKYHLRKVRPLFLLMDVIVNFVFQMPKDVPYFLFLPLTKIDTLYDVLSKRTIPVFLEIFAEIQETELINDKFVMDKALVANKPSKSAKKKKKKKDKRRKEQLRKDMMRYLKENIICTRILQGVYKIHEIDNEKKVEDGAEVCSYKNRIESDEARNSTLCPTKTNSTDEVSQMQVKLYPHGGNVATDKHCQASFEDKSQNYLQISRKVSKSGSIFSVDSLSTASPDNEFDISRPTLKRRSRSVSRFDKNENTKSLTPKLTVGSSSSISNFPKYRNAKCQTLAPVSNEEHECQLKKQNEALRQQLHMLQSKIETLYLEKRDLQAEREVYRYELSSYKEAVSALRASGCVPPKAALLPSQQMSAPSGQLQHGPLAINNDGLPRGTASSTAELENQLTVEIEAFVRCVRADADDRLLAFMTALRRCTSAVHSLWPRAQVKVYGSFATGFQLPRSDLDLLISLPHVQRQEVGEAGGTLEGRNAIKETWQQELSRCLKECAWVFHETVQCHGNAVPIITLATRPLGGQGLKGKAYSIRCDISLFQESHKGLQTNRYLQSLTRQLSPLIPLVLVMKEFLSQQGFLTSFTGGLSSYGLVLLVSRFLQSIVENDLDGFSNYSLGGLLLAFLDHLGNRFDPASTGISVHNCCYLDRLKRRQAYVVKGASAGNGGTENLPHASDDGRAISECDNMHQHSRVYGYDPHKFDPLHIEDPLLPTNNVGRNCFRINYILRACSDALSKILSEGPSKVCTRASEFSCLQSMMIIPKSFIETSTQDYKPLVLSADHLAQHNRAADSQL